MPGHVKLAGHARHRISTSRPRQMVLDRRKPHDQTEEDEHLVFHADVALTPGRRQQRMASARQNVLL
eukprot:2106909-Pyramimonas_sp.AAC.1